MTETFARAVIPRSDVKLLSLCTGYGGLDLAVEAFFGAELVACADTDKSASMAIDKHFGVPNLGDIKQIDWAALGTIDMITAGYPCQPFSAAGQRKGSDDARHIWPYIKEGIGILRPGIVVLENVRGHLSLGFKEVLADLASIGYDAIWTIVRASDVGAPHQRARLFIIAYANGDAYPQSRRADRDLRSQTSQIFDRADREESGCCFENVSNADDSRGFGDMQRSSRGYDTCCQSESFGNSDHEQLSADRQTSRLGRRFASRSELSMQAIPDPLVDGKLNTRFVEYMMGLPAGWVTDLPISRAQQFKLLGNGVVPQQAFYALEKLCKMRHAF